MAQRAAEYAEAQPRVDCLRGSDGPALGLEASALSAQQTCLTRRACVRTELLQLAPINTARDRAGSEKRD